MRVILKTPNNKEYLDLDDLGDIAEIVKHRGNITISLPDEEDEEGCELVFETQE